LVPRDDDAGPGRAEDGLSVPAHEEAPVRRRASTPILQRASWRQLVPGVALAFAASGCGLGHLSDLNFRVDDRLHFTSPKDRATVGRPLTVTWTIRDFRIEGPGSTPPSKDAGYFAAFVDRAPIKPGQTLRVIGKGDPVCENDPKCPDTAYLNAHHVYTTTGTRLRLTQIPTILGDRERLQLHTITVVLMDTAGHRIGESAWELDVRLPRLGVA
jgi:hypothetical protein